MCPQPPPMLPRDPVSWLGDASLLVAPSASAHNPDSSLGSRDILRGSGIPAKPAPPDQSSAAVSCITIVPAIRTIPTSKAVTPSLFSKKQTFLPAHFPTHWSQSDCPYVLGSLASRKPGFTLCSPPPSTLWKRLGPRSPVTVKTSALSPTTLAQASGFLLASLGLSFGLFSRAVPSSVLRTSGLEMRLLHSPVLEATSIFLQVREPRMSPDRDKCPLKRVCPWDNPSGHNP